MNNYNYDSYCGIYCGACDIMMTHKTGIKRRLASFWNESMVRRFQKNMGNEDIIYSLECRGCKTDTLFANCAACKIRKCAIDKRVEHCSDCDEYPCGLILEMKKIGNLLPHWKSNVVNLETIKRIGVSGWLAEQEKKWKCPECGTAFSWYTAVCNNCGRNLRKYSFKFSFLQALLLKTGIYLFVPKQR